MVPPHPHPPPMRWKGLVTGWWGDGERGVGGLVDKDDEVERKGQRSECSVKLHYQTTLRNRSSRSQSQVVVFS